MKTDVESGGITTDELEKKFLKTFASGDIAHMRDLFEKFRRLMSYYRCAMMETETKFKVLDEQFSTHHARNPIDTIKTRLKSLESIMEKLERRSLPRSLTSIEQNLNDVAGVRIICPFKDDIYMLADCFLKQDDVELVTSKDYIKNPKPNGYRSLHLIIGIPVFLQQGKRQMRVEVQLRTIAMEFWANLEHELRYKKNLPPELIQSTAKRLYDCAERSALLDDEMQRVRLAIEGI